MNMKQGIREKRIADYEKPSRWPSGIANQENIAAMGHRASLNSQVATRAKGGTMRLPDTGGDMDLRDTASAPLNFGTDPYPRAKAPNYSFRSEPYKAGAGKAKSGGTDPRAAAKADLNHNPAVTSYQKGVRRSV
jgi:hypothetical protein